MIIKHWPITIVRCWDDRLCLASTSDSDSDSDDYGTPVDPLTLPPVTMPTHTPLPDQPSYLLTTSDPDIAIQTENGDGDIMLLHLLISRGEHPTCSNHPSIDLIDTQTLYILELQWPTTITLLKCPWA